MTQRLRLAAFALLAVAIIGTSTTMAQPTAPMVEEDNELFDLNERLNKRYIEQKQKSNDFDLLKQLLKAATKNRSEADWKKFLENNPALQNPETLEKLAKLALDQTSKLNGAGKLPQVEKLQKLVDQLKQEKGPPQQDPPIVPKDDPKVDPMDGPPMEAIPPPPPIETKKEAIERDPQTRDWLRWAEKNFGDLSDNDAIQDMLAEIASGDADAWGKEFNELFGDLDSLKADWKDSVSWLEKQVGSPSSWALPDINIGTPTFGGGGAASSGGSFFNGSTVTETGGTWLPVILLGVIATGGLLYWWLRGMEAKDQTPAPTLEERLGPWPVDPRSIRDREALIRAVEYLSLSQCGLEAKTWNHRLMAEQLNDHFPGEEHRLQRLADLYEQARYAPDLQPMTTQQLDTARQDICTLIGVPT